MSLRIVDPVVVYPETLSNQAFIRVNSPPHITYGIMPKTKERSQDRTMVRNPSLSDIDPGLGTNMNGKAPARRVITKLMRRGVKPESIPYITDTTMDKNMNKALTSSAMPTL